MNGIIPKSKAKGTDICKKDNYYYIIRSDLGCYMKTSNFNKGSDISIFSLHPSCKNGDHYLGSGDGSFYIIKGNEYRRVSDLTTDSDAVVDTLHPNCRGGDHYFSAYSKFFIIFQEKGTYRITTDMNTDSDAEEHDLHPDCRNGLYYWDMTLPIFNRSLFCFLKPDSEWGVEFCNLSLFSHSGNSFIFKNLCTGVYSVHPDVLNFLPGGLTVTIGPAICIWENIKTITNDSNTPVTWTKKINKKVGYNKEKMSQITHHWKIDTSASIETGALAKLIAKFQFSFSAEYGGSHVSTENESWNEMTEVEEELKFELKPNESLYLWQYRMGLGQEQVLFCRDLKITSDPNPPTEVPLPPAQS
ncbi:uncharacterized protein LOC127519199 [Ctenopharyngodon idella]|uniref:uncharacterized protein LOC127519199 n=1 Tax=Ctenopharyngodon idella TaxID=7959 RepID=UPI002231AD65|nr:uncharacterized protein LOC127519199 [Ctenopharyngodon idella]XP_051762704.1 uncharacterized protein LOC127519199 [Ctenopharyngodon idella]XP_051762705.1 uncharacterized protein LOC127519199 [Ctenopharyngodon idella]